MVRKNYVLLEGIRVSFGRANHTDDFGVALTSSGLQGCNNFLCHRSISPLLFDFFMYGHLLQVRVVLLELQTLGGILFIFGGDIAAHARNTTIFLLGALEDHLHSSVFILLCHFSLILSVFVLSFRFLNGNGKEHQQSTFRSSKAIAKILLFFQLPRFFSKKISINILLT